MNRQKIVILPKIYDANGDMDRNWFVYFSVRNPKSGKMERFRKSGNINQIVNKKNRLLAAEELRENYRLQLVAGWSPFTDDEQVIYDDHLQYRNISDIYSKKRKSNRTLHYFSSRFIASIRNELSPATVLTYTSKVRTFNVWIEARGLADNDVSAINNAAIKDFFIFLIETRKLSGNSIGKYRQILWNLFEYIIGENALRVNQVYNMPKCGRINDQAARPVYEYDIQVFKNHIEKADPQLWMAIEFQYYCFIRPGSELRLLKIKDIDFARGLIFLNRNNFKTKKENVKEVPRDFLMKLRHDYDLGSFDKEFYVFGQNGGPGPDYLGKNNLRFRFVKYRKILKMPTEYKFYSWKHTGSVMASEAGIPDKDISDQMGHTSLQTTSAYLKSKGGRRINSIRDNYPRL